MLVFWIVAGLLSAVSAGLMLMRAAAAEAVDPTLPVYRRQLAEIDDLAERGLIAGEERKRAHAEAARRLLAAAEQPDAPWTGARRRAALIAAAAAPMIALALYLAVGAPGVPDQPFARRLSAWRNADPSHLTPPEMAAVLGVMTRERPGDAEAYRYLAMAQGASGDTAAAIRALDRAIALAPRRADLWETLGEVMIVNAGGGAPPEARAAFRRALALDPTSMAARFHLARAQVIDGDKAGGIAAWRALLAELPADDPRRRALIGAIGEAEHPAPEQPDAAAGGEELAAIQGMVANLAARLEAKPDDPEGWVRLVRSYAVLGDTARRDAALAKAEARFAGRSEVMSALAAAAKAEPLK